ncbi:hypothetical protein D3C78_1723230 [compost metagenome]
MEQAYPQAAFEPRHAFAHGRGTDAQRLAGGDETAGFSHPVEDHEAAEAVHAAFLIADIDVLGKRHCTHLFP